MDPLGLPLETFDAIGRYRTTDHGLPIDPSGDFNGQPVADARGLGQAVGASLAVARCLVRKYYAYAMGHEERSADGSVLNTLADGVPGIGLQAARSDPRRRDAATPSPSSHRNPDGTVTP